MLVDFDLLAVHRFVSSVALFPFLMASILALISGKCSSRNAKTFSVSFDFFVSSTCWALPSLVFSLS